ncbi:MULTISPECIES: hypothetical protein [Rhodococcus]|uniref:hypothetical protein n=1 Tax=Rhodococcus TaxID=1827 RepID=UPI00193BA251|nr:MULTISPECIES: hypothetical protein [Rhodococcus]QRI76264.1 hypothetical protein JQ505_00065 [Rhodococcus aetherivorans]QSE59675.1 hypothetical protein JYA75_01180 [Rhodococcus sp. PSBB066]
MKIRTPHLDVATAWFSEPCKRCGVDATWHVKVQSPRFSTSAFFCGQHVPNAALDQYLTNLAAV